EMAVTDRRDIDRRKSDRRKRSLPVATDRRLQERRQHGGRGRQGHPTTCERDYTDEEIVFIGRMDQYKRHNRLPLPTSREDLEVSFWLGYRKVAEAAALRGLSASAERMPPPKG